MALNVISNFAANIAQRNLAHTEMQTSASLAKLSSGSRVVSAKDDAASLAIGSRLAAEVSSLRQASVNAGQATSMLQIADGAMARVNDILTRMKTLAVQASSGQLSSTERGMLDTEYQALISEIDRIAEDTEFNGNQLVNGTITVGGTSVGTSGAFATADGVSQVTGRGFETANTYTLSYASGTDTFTLADGTTNWTGVIDSNVLNASNQLNTGTAVTLTNATSDAEMVLVLNTAFQSATSVAASTNNAVSFTGSDTSVFSFKVGSGTDVTADVVSISMSGVNADNLAVAGTDITSTTNADAASEAVSAAIDTLNTARANIGAGLSRIEFAAANVATAVENAEAARSALLDLDVASEMTNFTSKQILMQAGVSMLAQANQLPQNLLKLFQ